MRVAITGGTGFIGKALQRNLAERGDDVLVLGRKYYPEAVYPKRCAFRSVDILDYAGLENRLKRFKPDLVVHLAGVHFIPYCETNPALTLRTNVEGTLNVLMAAAASGNAKGMVFASSAAVYGPRPFFHRESDDLMPCEIYGLSKAMAEQILRLYASAKGLSYVIARIFNVYGPGDEHPYVINELVRQVAAGADVVRVGPTNRYRDFIYVDDVAEGLRRMGDLAATATARAEILNLATGSEFSVGDVIKTLKWITGKNFRVAQQRARLRRSDRRYLRADISHMRRVLRWRPSIGLPEGLGKLLLSESASSFQS